MNGDVTVLGMQPGTCPLLDIGMDVPYGLTVTIPADKASRSKDLWRSVSQKLLFCLHSGPIGSTPAVSQGVTQAQLADLDALKARCQVLEDENQVLQKENQVLKASLGTVGTDRDAKIELILKLLKEWPQAYRPGYPIPQEQEVQHTPYLQAPPSGCVDMAPPPFVPSKIRPDDMESAHIQLEKSTADGGSTAEAGSKLRYLRKKNQS